MNMDLKTKISPKTIPGHSFLKRKASVWNINIWKGSLKR